VAHTIKHEIHLIDGQTGQELAMLANGSLAVLLEALRTGQSLTLGNIGPVHVVEVETSTIGMTRISRVRVFGEG
jgi:hypothetical protein